MTQHWFEPLAAHMGTAYDRYAHTKGTVQEIDHVVDVLGLEPGQRVLDVGCGTGRHAHELARRGIEVHGVDISERFIEIAQEAAPQRATFERCDARSLGFQQEFDAVICLCQGAFGMMTANGDDAAVIAGMSAALRRGGRLVLSAFNAYFAVKYTTRPTSTQRRESATSGPRSAASPASRRWSTCGPAATHRENSRQLLGVAGFEVESISSVEPGAYGREPATVESPEFLVVAGSDTTPAAFRLQVRYHCGF